MVQKIKNAAYLGLTVLTILPSIIPKVPIPVQMLGLATLIIFIGAINSAQRERKRVLEGSTEARDVIGRDQAARFPVIASMALFGMFLAFKYLPKEWVSFLLTLYGVCFGGLALGGVIGSYIGSIPAVPDSMKKEFGKKDVFMVSACDILGLLIAAPITYWYYTTKNALANNLLGGSLALSAIEMIAIPDFKTAAILLCGLFFYDIFWVFGSKSVFGSNVMVSVAKQFQGPIKLIFPRFLGAGDKDSSLLGLGDIVIPGFFIALMVRFDLRNLDAKQPIPDHLPYFYVAIVAYIAGLAATYAALAVFHAAQPALLYLVPALLLSILAFAFQRKQFGELIAYTEEEEEEADEKEKASSEKTPLVKDTTKTSATDDGEESVVTSETKKEQ